MCRLHLAIFQEAMFKNFAATTMDLSVHHQAEPKSLCSPTVVVRLGSSSGTIMLESKGFLVTITGSCRGWILLPLGKAMASEAIVDGF